MSNLANVLAGSGNAAVAGVQYGDEGKGQIVDGLSDRFKIVARYNGGANAGHSVWVKGEKYALHLIPCGILTPGTVNLIGNGVVVDPAKLMEESRLLRGAGLDVNISNLLVSDRAHVVMPYHKMEDEILDRIMAEPGSADGLVETTKSGIGPCYADKALRSTAIRMADVADPTTLRRRMSQIVAVKNAKLSAMCHMLDADFTPFRADDLMDEVTAWSKALAPHVADTRAYLQAEMEKGSRVLFEGANATLLDVDFGTYPYVTSSSCCSLGVYAGVGVPGGALSEAIGVAKVYMSRVGTGPFPTEINGETADHIRNTAGEFGTTTGRPRRIGWLDLVALRYSVQVNGSTALALTGLWMLQGLDSFRACTHYALNGNRLDTLPGNTSLLNSVTPVYTTFPGFAGGVTGCRSLSDLPGEAKQYLDFIQDYAGVPVKAVCVGKRRDEILTL